MKHRAPYTTRRLIVAVVTISVVCGGVGVGAFALRNDHKSAAATTTTTQTTTAPESSTTAPPSPSTTEAAIALPLAGKVIVLDPGHNEHNGAHTSEINQQVDIITKHKECDTTGTSTNGGFSEAAFNTDLANRVATLLRDEGATVVLTRGPETPWGPCITERAAIGNNANADAAVSIHADGGPSTGRGFHVIRPLVVPGHNDAIIEPSRALAIDLHDAFRDQTGMPTSTYIGSDGMDARDDLGGLNLSTVPKVFIECGNMRNATDAAMLTDPAWRQKAAEAIVAGITKFVRVE